MFSFASLPDFLARRYLGTVPFNKKITLPSLESFFFESIEYKASSCVSSPEAMCFTLCISGLQWEEKLGLWPSRMCYELTEVNSLVPAYLRFL